MNAMRMKLSAMGLACGVAATPVFAQSQGARTMVAECVPPNGVWGNGGQYRSKIEKYSDGTAVYMSQNYATPNPNHWARSAPFPWAGGQYLNGQGIADTIRPDGDGYRVDSRKYYAHFTCHPAGK